MFDKKPKDNQQAQQVQSNQGQKQKYREFGKGKYPETIIPDGESGYKLLAPTAIYVVGDPARHIICLNCGRSLQDHLTDPSGYSSMIFCKTKPGSYPTAWSPSVASLQVRISQTEDGVIVDLIKRGQERPVSSTKAPFIGIGAPAGPAPIQAPEPEREREPLCANCGQPFQNHIRDPEGKSDMAFCKVKAGAYPTQWSPKA